MLRRQGLDDVEVEELVAGLLPEGEGRPHREADVGVEALRVADGNARGAERPLEDVHDVAVGVRIVADYPDQQKAVSEINEITRIMFTDWITSQVGDDPDLLAKVVPDYPATGKRTLQDNGSWLKTLTRDNVELVRTGIDRIEADAVVTEDGTRYPADVIVYATGFEHTKLLWPMTIRGRDGEVLSERWGERPSAYLGITIPGYPNFFCMYGPGTNLAQRRQPDLPLRVPDALHHTSVWNCSSQADTRRWSRRRGRTTDWHERSQAEMRTMVWSQPSIKHSFFKNSFGEVHTLSPWRLVDYWTWTREPDPDDFVFR